MAQDGLARADIEVLETLGRPVVHSRTRIAALLRARLGEAEAGLLAVPVQDDAGAITGWTGDNGQPLRSLAELPQAARADLQSRAALAIRNIDALAEQLDEQGDAGRVAAHMLRSALVTPTGVAALMTDGTRPVLSQWGHARIGQPRPDPLVLPSTPLAVEPASAPLAGVEAMAASPAGEAAADGAPAASAAPAVPPRAAALPLWAWGLPIVLLVLAGWLGWRAFAPLEPVTVEVVKPAPPAADPSVAPRARVDALRQALAEAEPLNDKFKAVCTVPPPPPPAAVVQAPTPAPPPEQPKPEQPKPEPAPPPKPAEKPEQKPKPQPPREAKPREVQPTPPKTVPPPLPTPQPVTPPPPAQTTKPSRNAAACTPPWKPEDPPRVVFVLDGSGSMSEGLPGGGSSKIGAAKRSISTVIGNLHPSIRTGMVSFSDCNATSRTPLYAAAQRPTLIGQVQGVRPTGGTSLAASITRAGNAITSTANLPSTIVVVSDGEDTCGRNPCQAAAAVRAAHPNVTINVIDLATDSAGRSALSCVARSGGGRIFTPQTAGQMSIQTQQASGYPDASSCK